MIVGSGNHMLTAFTFNQQNNIAITMAQDPLRFEVDNSYTFDNYITNGFTVDQPIDYDLEYPNNISISEVRVYDSMNVLLETHSINNGIINPVDRWGHVNPRSYSGSTYVMGINPIEEYDEDLRRDIITGYGARKLHFDTTLPMNGCRIEVDYNVPDDYSGQSIKFKGSAYHEDSSIDEIDFNDNQDTLTVTSNMQNFTVTSVKARSIRSGEDTYVKAKIRNTGEADFNG